MKEPFNTYYENDREVSKRLNFLQHLRLKPINNPTYNNHLPVA